MRNATFRVLLAGFLLGLGVMGVHGKPRAARNADDVPVLAEGTPVTGSIDPGGLGFAQYRIEVPDDAIMLSVAISNAAAELVTLVHRGKSFSDSLAKEAKFAEQGNKEQAIHLTRWSETPLRGGTYYLAIASPTLM
jgi:hypothetical protein